MMGNTSAEIVKVPRSFVLLGELEKAERGNTDMSISFGLVDGSDIMLQNWQCTILGPQSSPLDNRIVSLLLHCPQTYPDTPPVVRFQTKVNFPFVVCFLYKPHPLLGVQTSLVQLSPTRMPKRQISCIRFAPIINGIPCTELPTMGSGYGDTHYVHTVQEHE
tara:strand:+ start:485 stop:970 length:486 start_codon:yes stop_codon:yes gene_type:complete